MDRKCNQNLLDAAKAGLKEKCIAICTHIKKSNNLMIHLWALKKQQLIPNRESSKK